MSLANTLSVLLQFKTDLAGLQRAQAFLEGHVKKVTEFNAKLQNGTAALNNALQAGAALLTLGALREYSRDAIEARQAQAKLTQALTQAKQNTADYRAELGQHAGVLQRLTGLQDDVIVGVQRQLVFAGAQRRDIADLTRLTLDFAAAKEIDAVSAAKAVGRALMGEGDELARYGVRVDTAKDKVAALREGLGVFSGQSAQAFAALPPGLREFTVSSREAQQSFGDLVLEVSSPFLQALAGGIERANQRFAEMREHGSALQSIFTGLGQTLGDFLGGNLGIIMGVVGGLLALKGASLVTSQALSLLAGGFMALTGQNLMATVAGIRSLTKEVGLLKALSIGGWPGMLATGIVAIGGALAALALGSVLINSVQAAQLARLEREQQIRDAIFDQTRSLQQQAGGVRSWADVRNVRGEAASRVKTTQDRIAELAAKEAADRAALIAHSQSRSEGFGPRLSMTDAEATELEQLRLILPLQQRTLDLVNSREWAEAKIAAAKAAQHDAEQKAIDFELEKKLPELRQRRDEQNLADLDAAGRAQELMRRRAVLEKELDAVPLDKEARRLDLQNRIHDLTDKIVEANQQLSDKVREINEAGEERRKKLEEEAKQRKALVDLEAEQNLSRSLGKLGADRAAIEANQLLTEEEKRRRIIPLLEAENRLIAERIAAKEKEQGGVGKQEQLQLQEQIDALRAKQSENTASMVAQKPPSLVDQKRTALANLNDPSQHYQSAGEGIQGATLEAMTQLGTLGDNAAESISGTLNGALNATQGLLYNLASGAMSFRQAWGQAILQVGQQFLQSMTMMVAKMIWRATVERALVALGVTLHVGGEQTKTAATLWGGMKRLAMTAKEALADVFHGAVAAFKAMASIPYVGPILGAAAMAAALAGGMALVKNISGREDGGIVAGGRQLSWLNEAGTEAVIRAPSVRKFGQRFLADLNEGSLNLAALPGSIASQIPTAYAATSASSVAGSRSAQTAANPQALLDQERRGGSGGFTGSVIVAMGEDYLHDAIASTTGERLVVRASARNRRRLGIRT